MKTAMRNVILMGCTLLVCAGCQSMSIYEKRSMRAPSGGYVSEIDEPSSRGLLTRVSPEQSNVRGRFCFSRDESWIIFSGVQGAYNVPASSSSARRFGKVRNLWKIPTRGGAPVKITSGGDVDCESPSFTSDGKHIVYASGGTLWNIQSDGAGGRKRIPGSGMGVDLMPNVSRDDRLVFCSLQTAGSGTASRKYFIWTCELDGGNLTQMREGLFPMWSPDGERIVFGHNGDIWMINADGTGLTQLTNTSEVYEGIPSFSTSGERIVYVSNEGKDGKPMMTDFNIWAMRADGAEKEQITELDSWDSWPAWGKAGIYFLSARAAADRSNRLQRIWRLQRTEE